MQQIPKLPRGSSFVNPFVDHDQSALRADDTVANDSVDDLGGDGRSIIGISLGPTQSHLAFPVAAEERTIAPLPTDIPHATGATCERRYEEREDLGNTSSVQGYTFWPWVDEHDSQVSPSLQRPNSGGLPRGVKDNTEDEQHLHNLQKSDKEAYSVDRFGWRKYVPSLSTWPGLVSLKGLSGSEKLPTISAARDLDHVDLRNSEAIRHRNTLAGPVSAVGPARSRQNSSQGRRLTGPSHVRYLARQSGFAEEHGVGQRVRPPALRRTTSEGSLYLQRSLSRASSLGDDSRWTHVHEQVNSRAKAIRDTLADSNLKFPRLPDLPNLSISEVLSEFSSTRKRSNSLLAGMSKRNQTPERRQLTSPVNSSQVPVNKPRIECEKPSSPTGTSKTNADTHPQFTQALRHIRGDVVILGGYRGSILRAAEPPHRQCWVPVKVGLGLRKVNLEVGLERKDEERMEESIIPDGMLRNIGPVDISRRLFKRLSSSKQARDGTLRVWDFGYDWRLSPHLSSDRLISFLESLKCNNWETTVDSERGATVIAHSLGGLITRHAVNRRPELFSGVVYAGVPQSCVNILGPLRNGDEVLLSSRVLTAQVNFTIRTSFALLPLDGRCFHNKRTREFYDVDFFRAEDWEEYCFSPCVARPAPAAHEKSVFGSIVGIMDSMTNAIPAINIPGRYRSNFKRLRQNSAPITSPTGQHIVGMQLNQRGGHEQVGENPETSPSTLVTIPKATAMTYLRRILAEVKQFKQELDFDPSIDARHAYPPTAVIYGKSVPTVYGANVASREAIKRIDAYDDLAFASGDGVVLARAAQLPDGYRASKGGVVSSDRGHISLLGDLEAVGQCLNALRNERRSRQRVMA